MGLFLTILLREFVKDPFQVLLDIFSFISLDAILSSVDAINCVARVTPEVEYLIGSLIVPLFFTIGPILAHFNVVYMMRRAGKAKSFGLHLLWKTLGLFSLIFFISLCSSFFGALSVQQASQWLENFAELSQCPVWFHRDTFHPLSHWRLGLPVAHYLSCIVVLDHFGGVAQEGASGRYCLYPCMLILGHALPPREGDLLAKVLLYGNLCNRLLVMSHALIVPCEQFGSTDSCADSTWFLCWGLQKVGGSIFSQTGSLHSVVPDPKCAHRTCPFDSILLCESLLDGHAATLRKSTS